MPAIDTRLFWGRDFSIDEGFNFERGQPANRSLHIHVLETIDPPLIPQPVQVGLRTLDVARFSLISRRTHRAHAAFSHQSFMGAMEKIVFAFQRLILLPQCDEARLDYLRDREGLARPAAGGGPDSVREVVADRDLHPSVVLIEIEHARPKISASPCIGLDVILPPSPS
ncbi:hypothetical protein [Bradyrhizobium sp. AUGA SZCCT0431]|uniref:hypothetical protein n=1 Tax=Bradyrhizobium sp. AUGA SZCCT0431 TaxID=2807674 RepID=UPI001BAA7BAC|nr:hypothetical protein [Bradyrhizobium sp. AUGA SZCCT0431]MBR1143123.1 hypothetical protein [Bradyrhizobium sp. AUGA SZCCT0431]